MWITLGGITDCAVWGQHACPMDQDWVGDRAPVEPLFRLMATRVCLI